MFVELVLTVLVFLDPRHQTWVSLPVYHLDGFSRLPSMEYYFWSDRHHWESVNFCRNLASDHTCFLHEQFCSRVLSVQVSLVQRSYWEDHVFIHAEHRETWYLGCYQYLILRKWSLTLKAIETATFFVSWSIIFTFSHKFIDLNASILVDNGVENSGPWPGTLSLTLTTEPLFTITVFFIFAPTLFDNIYSDNFISGFQIRNKKMNSFNIS